MIKEGRMDSLEKIIEDMQESAIFYDKLLQYETSEAIRHYLTRLKALRYNLPHPPHPPDTN
jgi:hypothetical protein